MTTNNNAKIAFVMSPMFLALVNDNIKTMSALELIRTAERRFQFRNPRSNEIEITIADIERALVINNGADDSTDKLVNVYNWFKRTGRTIVGPVADLWARYKAYISSAKLEKLWAGTGVLDMNGAAEKEFNNIIKALNETK